MILIHCVRIAARLILHNALAILLVPAVLGAPLADGLDVGGGAARAGVALGAGAISAARGGSEIVRADLAIDGACLDGDDKRYN